MNLYARFRFICLNRHFIIFVFLVCIRAYPRRGCSKRLCVCVAFQLQVCKRLVIDLFILLLRILVRFIRIYCKSRSEYSDIANERSMHRQWNVDDPSI